MATPSFDFEQALLDLARMWPKPKPKPELRFERGMTIIDILSKNIRLLAPEVEDLPPVFLGGA